MISYEKMNFREIPQSDDQPTELGNNLHIYTFLN